MHANNAGIQQILSIRDWRPTWLEIGVVRKEEVEFGQEHK